MQVEKINKKDVLKLIEKNYGCRIKIRGVFLRTTKEKIWLASNAIQNFDFGKVKINSVGLYFGKLKRNDKIQLSIEGSQIVGRFARKNILELDKKQAMKYLQGFDVRVEKFENCEVNNFVILRFGKDIIGSGILREDGRIENLLPKTRRLYLEIKKI